jgi:hypothetical protein
MFPGRPQPQLQNSAHLTARSSAVCPQFPLSWSGASPSFPANHHTPILQKGLHETPLSPFFKWFDFCLLNRSERPIISFSVYSLPSLVSSRSPHPSPLKLTYSTSSQSPHSNGQPVSCRLYAAHPPPDFHVHAQHLLPHALIL